MTKKGFRSRFSVVFRGLDLGLREGGVSLEDFWVEDFSFVIYYIRVDFWGFEFCFCVVVFIFRV